MNDIETILGKHNITLNLTTNERAKCPYCKSTRDITFKYSNKRLKEMFCGECGYLYKFFN